MKTKIFILSIILCRFTLTAQVMIERAGSPDFQLANMNALGNGITARMFFKTGTYYTGGIATTGLAANSARLSFFTQASANQSNLLERMTILNNGFVGIGNVNPQYPLQLNASGIGFSQGSQAQIGFYTSTSEAYLQTHNAVPLLFSTNNGSAQMALTTAGRLGIGTTTPGSKLEVKGKTKIIQQAGEDAALEITGNIKVSGSNPAAFVVTATSSDQIIIDHPASNGNPNAIILVTARTNNDTYFNGSFGVEYLPNIAKWRIIFTGPHLYGTPSEENVEKCNGDCWNTARFVLGEQNHFVTGTPFFDPDSFNVLIIAN